MDADHIAPVGHCSDQMARFVELKFDFHLVHIRAAGREPRIVAGRDVRLGISSLAEGGHAEAWSRRIVEPRRAQ